MKRSVATGLSYGSRAIPEHAERSVTAALKRAGLSSANGVLLFLTPHYAGHPDAALRAAARAAGSLQIVGCTGAGVLTDQEWLLDSPGAAAMVFGNDLRLALPDGTGTQAVVSLCTPAGATADWFDRPLPRIGAVSGDIFGQGPFRVWSGCRVAESGHIEAVISGSQSAIGTSQGVRALTSPIEIAEVHGYDVLRLGHYPALNVLVQALPIGVREMDHIPLHLIMGGVTFGDPHTAIRDGRFRLNHIVSANLNDQSITLSHPLARGERLFWAMRDTLAAERDMRLTIERACGQLAAAPDFALMFPCMGRGPNFYGNRDRDLDQLRASFPDLPIIGFYGNGEIGPVDGGNHLYQYSTVLGLFRAQPA
ncbi:MAG: FIST C-terminal domain-containing protein [Gammaproteobacteria bacterium]|nr:FIST C-terminal domain-containing protein [Gammaproteobacteria bacterium]